MPQVDPGRKAVGAALVVGGGIGGMQAALDLAASGIAVHLVDTAAAIGGKMAQLDKTFPTNDCAMCTMAPRLVEVGGHKDVHIHTLSEVEHFEGRPGAFSVVLRRRPRHVDTERCTGCGACVNHCPTRNVVRPPVTPRVDPDPSVRALVDGIVAVRGHGDDALLPILQDINRALSWFPEPVLAYTAQVTGQSLTHIYRLATFYKAFSIERRGRNVIKLCQGTACYVRGSGRLLDRVGESLGIGPGETTADGAFTLTTVRCLGCCGLAPALMLGDAVHGQLTSSTVGHILAAAEAN